MAVKEEPAAKKETLALQELQGQVKFLRFKGEEKLALELFLVFLLEAEEEAMAATVEAEVKLVTAVKAELVDPLEETLTRILIMIIMSAVVVPEVMAEKVETQAPAVVEAMEALAEQVEMVEAEEAEETVGKAKIPAQTIWSSLLVVLEAMAHEVAMVEAVVLEATIPLAVLVVPVEQVAQEVLAEFITGTDIVVVAVDPEEMAKPPLATLLAVAAEGKVVELDMEAKRVVMVLQMAQMVA